MTSFDKAAYLAARVSGRMPCGQSTVPAPKVFLPYPVSMPGLVVGRAAFPGASLAHVSTT